MYDIKLIGISFFISMLLLIFIFYIQNEILERILLWLSHKNKSERYLAKITLYYSIFVIGILILFTLIDLGIYNEMKNHFTFITIIIVPVINFILFLSFKRMNGRKARKASIIISITWVLLILSILTLNGFAFSLEDYHPEWITTESTFNYGNNSYNISVKVITSVYTIKGFFVKTPLILTINEGVIRFDSEQVPENLSIDIKVKITPHAINLEENRLFQDITILPTKFDGYKYYNASPDLDKGWLISFPWSGQKYIISTILVDGVEVVEMERVELVNIEETFVKAQVDQSRAVLILTYWIVFFSFLAYYPKFYDWLYEVIRKIKRDW